MATLEIQQWKRDGVVTIGTVSVPDSGGPLTTTGVGEMVRTMVVRGPGGIATPDQGRAYLEALRSHFPGPYFLSRWIDDEPGENREASGNSDAPGNR